MQENNNNNKFFPNLSRRSALQAIAGLATTATTLGQIQGAQAQDTTATTETNQTTRLGRYLTIDGNRVYIEERGNGIPIVMSPGGQNRIETLRPLAEKLAKKYRVICWDRANLGYSDVVFEGARDLDLWSDQLAGIIRQLDIRPAYLVGASSAARAAYTTALRYPDHTRGLLTYLTTGGGTIGERLANRYYYSYAEIAETEGMLAVSETPFWADRIALNSNNKNRLLSIDPKLFALTMRRWGGAMRSSDVMIGISPDGCRRIKENGTPTAITQGCEESGAHRKDRSELFAELTGATLIPTPKGYCEEATTGPAYDTQIEHPEVPESPPFRGYELLSMMPEVIDEFIQTTETGYKERGLGSDAFSFNVVTEQESEGES